jgi:DNA-binding response OmpR family regulator
MDRKTPILFISAVYTDLAHAEQYAREDLAAQGYLVKPFDLAQLLSKIQTLLTTPRTAP